MNPKVAPSSRSAPSSSGQPKWEGQGRGLPLTLATIRHPVSNNPFPPFPLPNACFRCEPQCRRGEQRSASLWTGRAQARQRQASLGIGLKRSPGRTPRWRPRCGGAHHRGPDHLGLLGKRPPPDARRATLRPPRSTSSSRPCQTRRGPPRPWSCDPRAIPRRGRAASSGARQMRDLVAVFRGAGASGDSHREVDHQRRRPKQCSTRRLLLGTTR